MSVDNVSCTLTSEGEDPTIVDGFTDYRFTRVDFIVSESTRQLSAISSLIHYTDEGP